MAQEQGIRQTLIYLTIYLFFFLDPLGSAHAGPYTLSDTGQTKCYNNSGEIPCPQSSEPFYGQDGNYQGPQSVYQLSADGFVVTDGNTGMVWQQADDGVTRDWDDAIAYCETLDLGGHSDWRLPSRLELLSIADYGRFDPAIDPVFSAQSDSGYWSNSIYESGSTWSVDFKGGGAEGHWRGLLHYVRCVRGGALSFGPFVANNNGAVTDTSTGLMWQQADDSQTRDWQDALSYCEGLDLAGQTDWRLPDIRELHSLVDDSRYNPAIDPVFTIEPSEGYWSGSSWAGWEGGAWQVFASTGGSGAPGKGYMNFVRCVRGGPTGSNELVLPTSQRVFNLAAAVDPVLNGDAAQAIPIGIGPVASGGNNLRLRIATNALSGPGDIYLGLFIPGIDGEHIYILKPDLTFQSHLEGVVPWKGNVSGPVNENLFGDIPTSLLPKGTYYLYLAITASGQGFGEGFYLWAMTFEVTGTYLTAIEVLHGGLPYQSRISGLY